MKVDLPQHLKPVAITVRNHNLVILTDCGRLFEHVLDDRNFDHRQPDKRLWREIEPPAR